MAFLFYPIYLIIFWYKDVLSSTFRIFTELNKYISSLLSIQLLFRTFFQPLKNEYRQGLVGFSRLFGVLVKSFLLSISFSILLLALILEVGVLIILIILPFSFIFIPFFIEF